MTKNEYKYMTQSPQEIVDGKPMTAAWYFQQEWENYLAKQPDIDRIKAVKESTFADHPQRNMRWLYRRLTSFLNGWNFYDLPDGMCRADDGEVVPCA